MKMKLVFLLVVVLVQSVQNARILLVNPMPSYSHFIIPFKLAEELANRGHHVTAITSYPQKNKIKNYVDIPVTENIALVEDMKKNLFGQHNKGILENLSGLFDLIGAVTNATIQHKNVQKLLQSDQEFDVVITEHFLNEAFVGFGHRFKAPVILVYTHGANVMNNYIFANPSPLAYFPGSGGTLTKKMNFWERLQNVFSTIIFTTIQHCYHLPKQNEIFQSYVKDVPFDDVLYNTSLMLTNSHVSASYAIPHVPSIVEVGGFYITTKPLPEDLQKFLDDAKEGVVLFSMGSNLRSDDLKPEVRDNILRAFGRIKQKVLWKFETDFPNTPPNVKISHWLPQADILNHPNVRAFITHGGRLSTMEAVRFGVPIIGIPVFGDQPGNVAIAIDDGYALKVDLDDLTEEALYQALNEILTNPKYRENVQHRSRLMQDQPIKPMDAAVFWVEHVIRNKGAPHLRSPGLDLKWYQRELIDIYAFILLVFAVLHYVVCKLVKRVWKLVFCKSTCVKKEKKVKTQ